MATFQKEALPSQIGSALQVETKELKSLKRKGSSMSDRSNEDGLLKLCDTLSPSNKMLVRQKTASSFKLGDPVYVDDKDSLMKAFITKVGSSGDYFTVFILETKLIEDKVPASKISVRCDVQPEELETFKNLVTSFNKSQDLIKVRPHLSSPLESELLAKQFLSQVRNRIERTLPRLFISFLGMMSEYHRGTVSIEELSNFIIEAFGEDNTDLVMMFNVFLPQDMKITPAMIRKRLSLKAARQPCLMMTTSMLLTFVRSPFRKDPNVTSVFRLLVSRYQKDRNLYRFTKDLMSLFAEHPDFLKELLAFVPTDAT